MISEFVLTIWSWLLFAVAITFFFFVYKVQALNATERQIEGVSDIPASSSTLINYLRTPVIVEDEEINMAELIRLWDLDNERYKNILEESSLQTINSLEYVYTNPAIGIDNDVIRGYNIIINSEKKDDNSLDFMIDFESDSFESGFCIKDEFGRCIRLGEQFIPISEDDNLYIVMFESQKAT